MRLKSRNHVNSKSRMITIIKLSQKKTMSVSYSYVPIVGIWSVVTQLVTMALIVGLTSRLWLDLTFDLQVMICNSLLDSTVGIGGALAVVHHPPYFGYIHLHSCKHKTVTLKLSLTLTLTLTDTGGAVLTRRFCPLSSTWPHLNSDVGLEEGEY